MLYQSLSSGIHSIKRKLTNCELLQKRGYSIYSEPLAFDIETTNDHERKQAFMYHWQIACDDVVVFGRTWQEFVALIASLMKLKHRIIVYVHNLSFEYQFIKTIIPLTDTMIIRGRKILRTCFRNIEFRCSYLLSNMSLRKYLERWGVPAQKGELDYNKFRYPWTELNADEKYYCAADVVGLIQAIKAEMAYNKDDLRSIPLTSTGYVRREAKRVQDAELNQSLFTNPCITKLLQEAMRGGNTLCNRYRVGEILEGVQSADMSSAYPAVMVEEMFPITPFKECATPVEGQANIFRVIADNVRLRRYNNPAPYLSVAMCKKGLYNPLIFNGRVLGCDSCTFVCTDIDWAILQQQYVMENARITDCYTAKYGFLPVSVTDLILDYFDGKTQLKGIDDYQYMKKKNLLNSWYGMCVQSPTRPSYIEAYPDDNTVTIELDNTVDVDAEIVDYFKNAAVMPYQWGVWVTAHCRRRLQDCIDLVGDDFVYSDTDSCKYLGKHDPGVLLVGRHYHSKNKAGDDVYLGVWDIEQTADRFVTLGAKKYAAEYDGKLSVTVAGVAKKEGAELLAAKGGIEAFRDGLVFENCGGLAAYYNDTKIGFAEYEEGRVLISSNTYLKQVDYTLQSADSYWRLLDVAEFS